MVKHEKPTFDPPTTGGIVAGYDGSADSAVALAWAAEQARLKDRPLHVVRAWKLSTAMPEMDVPFGSVPSWDECAEAMRESVARAMADLDVRGIDAHPHVLHGSPSNVLLAAAEEAALLVVAKRGGGGFAGLSLGSVAEQAVRHAACTVVVVRPQEG
jgi:nucleotide-binding universal stress UspA family protein